MKTTTPSSNDVSSPSSSSNDPRHSQGPTFTMDRVKTMFSCLSSADAEPAAELCALYLSGSLSADLFEDHPMGSGSSSSGSSSPLDNPLATSNNNNSSNSSSSVPVSPSGPRAGQKRSSVKRRKNCKLNHKVDGNRHRAENESEESMHFFPTVGPSPSSDQNAEKTEETPSPSKSSNGSGSPQQQFDGTLATLSGHLLELQEEVDKVVTLSSVFPSSSSTSPLPSKSKTELENGRKVLQQPEQQSSTTDGSRNVRNSSCSSNSSEHLNALLSEPLLALLQHLYRDLNKVKRYLTFKTSVSTSSNAGNGGGGGRNRTRSRTKSTSSNKSSSSIKNGPESPASSPTQYNSHVERLLSNRGLLLQLLHLECTLLSYLDRLAGEEVTGGLDDCAGTVLASPQCSLLQSRLEDLLKAYYMLLTKLSYEPTFVRVVSLLHVSTPVNGARLLAILFRSLVLKEQNELKKKEKKMKKEDSVSSEDDPFKGAEEEEMELKVETTTTTANGRGERHHRATMRAMTSSTSTFNGNGCEMIANNRTLVLMLSFVEALAKEDLFACSASGKPQQQITSLVVVCQGILAYFAGENEDDHERKNFSGKSLVRQRAIETLAHLCLTKNGLLDAIQRGGGPLLQTLLALISRCAHQHTRLVMRQTFLKSVKEEEEKAKEDSNASTAASPDSKQYIAVLRDIYGLLSTLISLTEFRSGREHLLFHEVGQRLFSRFMSPFVEMLNGTEADDPRHFIEAGKECPPLKEPAEAYRLLRQFFTGNQKMQRYLDRIIGISSIIIQRLLEPMPIPELEMEVNGGMNPFTFALPTEDLHHQQQQQQNQQQQQQPIQQDQNARDGLTSAAAAAAATPSASPLDLTLDDSKESHHFEAFDSDLDEDDQEEEEEDEDAEEEDGEDLDEEEDEGDDSEDEEEDSFERVKGSGNANVAAAESPDHFGRQLSATLGQQQQQQTKPSSTTAEQDLFSADETNLLRPYLRFFPELQHFNVPAGSKNDEEDCRHLLDCSCTLGSSTTADQEEEEEIVRRLLARHQLQGSNSSNAGSGSVGPFARLVAPSLPPPPGAEPFDWASVYRRLAPSTASVMPRSPSSLPLPDLHFLQGSSGQRNETASPMSYPFLRRAPTLRKNYHHIKLVDHVRERLNGNGGRPLYQVIYDVQKEDNIMPQGRQIKFDSKFECGNLRKVLVKENPTKNEKEEEEDEEFLLLLNTDVNSATHTQWFYFSVSGMAAGRRYRFKIINLQKKSILYNSGQQPVLYSRRDFEQHRKMWQRVGDSTDDSSLVAYYRNHYVRGSSVGSLFADKPFYTLEFTYRARNDATDDDLVYFSYNVPYGYTFLRTTIAYWEHLVTANNRTEAKEEDKVYFAHQTLCCSLKGNDLPLLTITGSGNESIKGRHYVLLSARVHPSESNSSWILKGFLDYLLHRSADPELEALRRKLLRNYVFKVLPMLNPDGVINGCTRTDLQTDDLNRQWQRPSPLLHPTIYHARNVLRALKHFSGVVGGGHNPVAFVDLHGHSRRKNIFSYSCSPALSWRRADRSGHKRRVLAGHLCTACSPSSKGGKGGGNSNSSSSCQLRGQMKVLKRRQAEMGSKNEETHSPPGFYLLPPFATLPVLLQLAQAPAFSLDSCSFAVQRDREHTARVVGWRHFAIPLVYTVECTASGCDVGPYAGRHLTVDQLEEMGAYLAAAFAFLDFLHCGGRHVPVIVLPKTTTTAVAGNGQQQTTTVISPVRHPGNDDFLRGLLEKCTRSRRGAGALLRRRAAPGADGTNRYQIRSLLQLYPDLNMLSASVLSTTTSSSSNSTTSLSSADSAAPKSPAKKKKAEEKEEEKET